MNSPNEFWLNLHRLATAYEAEGSTTGERNANITRQFEDMPFLAQREVLQELQRLVHRLPDLYPSVAEAANASARSHQAAANGREDVA